MHHLSLQLEAQGTGCSGELNVPAWCSRLRGMNGVALQELRKQMSACWCVPAVTGTQPPTAAWLKPQTILKKNWWILGLNIQPRRQTVIYKGYKLMQRSKDFSPSPHSHLSAPPITVITSPPPKVSACCFRSYHAGSEGSSLTFDVAQNWIFSLILWPSPSPCLIHAVTNWVARQQPGCVNGRLLVKTVHDLSSVSLSLSLVVY